MADILPTEGLDYLVTLAVKTGTAPTSLYVGLLTGGDGTTVPAATATMAAMGAPFAEASFTSYARVEVPDADWGAIAGATIWGTAVRAATAAQKSFPAAGAADATANITGFFLATAGTIGGGVALYYSNFVDGAADVIPSLALGDIVRVTPQFGLGNS